MTDQPDRTVLFVHAHPDDETIMTGGTMAALAASGTRVVLLTATRGEGGEVIGDELKHLEGDRPALAAHREEELAQAMTALGVSEHFFLGTKDGGADPAAGLPERRFEDSGMQWGPDGHAMPAADMAPAALCAAPVNEPSRYVRAVIERVQPDLVITYSQTGGYGHPDHVRTHEMTLAAVESLPEPQRPAVLFADYPAAAAQAMFDPHLPGFDLTGFQPAETIPAIPAELPVHVAQDVSAYAGQKAMALAAHATQAQVAGQFFALSNNIGQAILETEYFTAPGPAPTPPLANVLDVIPAEVTRARTAAGTSGAEDSPAATGGHPGAAGAESAPGPRRKKIGVGAVIHTVLLGLLVCILGTFQHLNVSVLDLGGQVILLPWGLLLAAVLTGFALWHIAETYRSTALMVLMGALISLGSFGLGQSSFLPGSDLLVVNNLRSVAWLFAPMILAGILAFSLPALKHPRRQPADEPQPTETDPHGSK